jgi:hypothetical protein
VARLVEECLRIIGTQRRLAEPLCPETVTLTAINPARTDAAAVTVPLSPRRRTPLREATRARVTVRHEGSRG